MLWMNEIQVSLRQILEIIDHRMGLKAGGKVYCIFPIIMDGSGTISYLINIFLWVLYFCQTCITHEKNDKYTLKQWDICVKAGLYICNVLHMWMLSGFDWLNRYIQIECQMFYIVLDFLVFLGQGFVFFLRIILTGYQLLLHRSISLKSVYMMINNCW